MRSFAIDEILLTLAVTLVPYETSEMFHHYHPYFHKYFYIFLFGGCCFMEPGNYCSWNARRHLANAGTFRDVWFCVIPWKLLTCCLCLKQNIAKGTTEDWVLVTKVTSFGHITSSQTNLDQISSSKSWPNIASESRPRIIFIIATKRQQQNTWLNLNFKILTKHSFQICTKLSYYRQHASKHKHEQQ